jgi:hypothetical protein
MKYLKKFNNLSDYEVFKNGGEFIIPNISYIESESSIVYSKPTFYATYRKIENEPCMIYDTHLMESLIIDGQQVDLENDNYSSNVCIGDNINLTIDFNNESVTINSIPDSYFNFIGDNLSIKPIDNSVSIKNIGYGLLVIKILEHYVTQIMPISDLVNAEYATYDEYNNSLIVSDKLLNEELSGIGQCLSCVILGDVNLNTGEFVIYDTENNFISSTHKIENEGLHEVEFVMKNKSKCPRFNYSLYILGSSTHSDKSLISVKIPNGVTEIYSYTFGDCNSLETCIMPNTINKIGVEVFMRCYSLKNIVLSENITTLPGNGPWGSDSTGVFYECSSLETITLPKNINYIGRACFY